MEGIAEEIQSETGALGGGRKVQEQFHIESLKRMKAFGFLKKKPDRLSSFEYIGGNNGSVTGCFRMAAKVVLGC